MATVSVRELARNTTSVIQGIQSSGRPALVTRNGRPVVALIPIDEVALEDWLLTQSPDISRAAAGADPDLDAGRLRNVPWQGAGATTERASHPDRASPPQHLRGSHLGA